MVKSAGTTNAPSEPYDVPELSVYVCFRSLCPSGINNITSCFNASGAKSPFFTIPGTQTNLGLLQALQRGARWAACVHLDGTSALCVVTIVENDDRGLLEGSCGRW